jgi:hypothetical protein
MDISKDVAYCFGFPHLNGIFAMFLLLSIIGPIAYNIYLCYDPIEDKFFFDRFFSLYMEQTTQKEIDKKNQKNFFRGLC